MGNCDGDRQPPENILHVFERSLERRTFSIQFVDHDGARQTKLIGEAPDLFGLDLDAGHAIHQHQRGIGGDESRLGVVNENVETRRIQKIDLLLGPFGESQAGGYRQLALNFLVVEVGDGVPFIHARQAIGGARGEQKSGGQGGLTAVPMAYQGNVSDVGTFVYFHSITLRYERTSRPAAAARRNVKTDVITLRNG